jgi:deferrochelatase/peroxidase EfeB
MQEQFEKRCIYQTWTYLWSAMFKYLDPSERKFRQA